MKSKINARLRNLKEFKGFLDSKVSNDIHMISQKKPQECIINAFTHCDTIGFKNLQDAIKSAVDKGKGPLESLKLAVKTIESHLYDISTINPEHMLCMNFHIFKTEKELSECLNLSESADFCLSKEVFYCIRYTPSRVLSNEPLTTYIQAFFLEQSNIFTVRLLKKKTLDSESNEYLVIDMKLVNKHSISELTLEPLYITESTLKQMHQEASGGKITYQRHELVESPQMLLNEAEATKLAKPKTEGCCTIC